MKSKTLSYLAIFLFSTSLTNASVIGWEVHNNTSHAVHIELWKHCMSDSPHDGPKMLGAGASYDYEELGSINSGTCFFESSFIMVRIYDNFKKSYISKLGCFTDGPQEELNPRVKISTAIGERCKLKVRFDINA
ncbi:MAG: hypothetical protein ACYCQI_13915 [Gammaproteobacteria bacterium]